MANVTLSLTVVKPIKDAARAAKKGMNRAIRLIINRAYGYQNFENFRLQILAQHDFPGP